MMAQQNTTNAQFGALHVVAETTIFYSERNFSFLFQTKNGNGIFGT
jgi:hypothetical protein